MTTTKQKLSPAMQAMLDDFRRQVAAGNAKDLKVSGGMSTLLALRDRGFVTLANYRTWTERNYRSGRQYRCADFNVVWVAGLPN